MRSIVSVLVLLVSLAFVQAQAASAPTHFIGVSLGGDPADDGSYGVALAWHDPCHWGSGSHDGFIITYAPYRSHNFEEYTTVDADTHAFTIFLLPGKWVVRVAAITNGHVGDYAQIVVRVP